MKNYIKHLFINRDNPLYKADCITILSILWLVNSFEITEKVVFLLREYLVLSNASYERIAVKNISVHFSNLFHWNIPFYFISLLICILFVRRLYSAKKSWLVYVFVGTLIFIAFRCLIFILMILLKEIWLFNLSQEGLITLVNQNIKALGILFFPLGILGILFVIIKFSKLKSNKERNQINTMSRERYAKIVLLLGGISYCSTLVLISCVKFYEADISNNINLLRWFTTVFGFILSVIGIVLIWSRLKDAGYSWMYILIPFLVGAIITLPFLVMMYQKSFIINQVASSVLTIGLVISFLFSLWLLLIPSKQSSNQSMLS